MRTYAILSVASVLLLPVVVSEEVECKATGYSCMGISNGDTVDCKQWVQSSSVCYEEVCYYPSDCVGSVVRAKATRPCVETGYICPATAEHSGKTNFCSGFAANSVCHDSTCFTPSDCKYEGRDGLNDVISQFFESVRAQSVEALIERLSSPGEDLDDVPQYFERLVAEVERDDHEPQFAGDMTIGDVVNVYQAIGYKDTVITGERSMRAFFDDEISVTSDGRSGVVEVNGRMYSDSFTISSCLDTCLIQKNLHKAFVLVNDWNENFRLSTAYLKTKDDSYSFCLQSEVQLTKYSKANIQIAMEQAAMFTVSIQSFHSKTALHLSIAHDEI